MLDSVGYLLLTVFLVAFAGIFAMTMANILSLNKWLLIPSSFLLLSILDYNRKDKVFLKSIFSVWTGYSIYLGIEYLFILSPFILFQFACQYYLLSICMITIALLIGFCSTFIHKKENISLKKEISIIPIKYFELKFAVENAPFSYVTIWVLGLLSFLHIGIYLVWIFIIINFIPQIFMAYESRDMIKWVPKFLFEKIISYSLFFLILITLPTILVIFMHIDKIVLICYGLVCLFTTILLTLAYKYESYTPLKSSSQLSSISSFLILLMILPGGVLITLSLGVIKYFKAEKNLTLLYA